MNIIELEKSIREVNDLNGWRIPKDAWEIDSFIPEKLMLVVTEVVEAMEAYRDNDERNFAEELADIVIRVFDLTSGLGIDIEKEIIAKNEINRSRAYKHGSKRA